MGLASLTADSQLWNSLAVALSSISAVEYIALGEFCCIRTKQIKQGVREGGLGKGKSSEPWFMRSEEKQTKEVTSDSGKTGKDKNKSATGSDDFSNSWKLTLKDCSFSDLTTLKTECLKGVCTGLHHYRADRRMGQAKSWSNSMSEDGDQLIEAELDKVITSQWNH